MSDRDDREGRDDQERDEPRRVKVTDKRRVRMEDEGATSIPGTAPDAAQEPGAGGAPRSAAAGETPEAQLEAARAEVAELRDQLLRQAAEFANARKRMTKEQTEEIERATARLVVRLLEVLDEFQLALMAAEQKPDFDRFLHGVELVYAKLMDILGGEGLEQIDADGRPFDPTRHEALMQSGHGEGEPVVVDVLRPGYTLRGRVVRPAGVKVSRG
jgi:molecular chaperone GrpE